MDTWIYSHYALKIGSPGKPGVYLWIKNAPWQGALFKRKNNLLSFGIEKIDSRRIAN